MENKKNESAYFSYGPYSSNHDRQEPVASETPQGADANQHEAVPAVEVTPPKPLRTYMPATGGSGGENGSGWQFTPPKQKSRVKSTFAAFMAGAVVMSGLMFAADKYNLFTGSEGVMAGTSSAVSASGNRLTNSGGSSSGVVSSELSLTRPNNIAEIVQQSSPAVVKIEVKTKVNTRRSSSIYSDPFFRYFFGDQPSSQSPQEELQTTGMGTGFIFEKSGYILTNEHVIEGADEIYVYVEGYEEPFKAELLGNSFDLDLAALKITGNKDFPTLPLGNPDELNVGDWVVAIGNPYGFDHTVTVGVLSAKEREIPISDENGTRNYKSLLQTDASINPGNSGGPLLNMKGEVIGINTAVNASAQGIGFAIPTTTVESVLDNLKNNIEIPKEPSPYLGVGLDNIDSSWVADLKLKNTEGALITQVERRSPAFEAGLRPYDVITALNDKAVKTADALVESVKKLKVGDTAKLTVIRDGAEMKFDVKIGDRNAQE